MKFQPTPSQTAGPFVSLGFDWLDRWPTGTAGPGAVVIAGRLFDGAGDPVGDAAIETWQSAPDVFTRCLTGGDGSWSVSTVKPDRLDAPGEQEAPHLDLSVFARGLMHRLVTRIYFADEAAANAVDPVLRSLPDDVARSTLVAAADGDGYRLDIHLQGPNGTVFFVL